MTLDSGVRVWVLGPIRVLDARGDDITPAGTLQRRLLALLVLRRDTVVAADTAIEALWPKRLPHDPGAALQNQVSRLRAALPMVRIASVGGGYRLASESIQLDADGLETDDADEVLARWHGPAYPELADTDDGRIEAGRLEELRVQVRERRVERLLAAGEPVPSDETARLVEEHPLRERPVWLLMRTLARDGRRAEALQVYDAFRRRLADELGIDPSPLLAQEHAAILRADTAAQPVALTARLPAPATGLIGREELLDKALVAVRDQRIVTLVGPGGVGKTSVAVALGHRLPSPAVLCELNGTPPESVVAQVAADLSIEPRSGIDLVERVATVLGDDTIVLILDGCEHALDAVAALVARLAARCPGLRVLVTSQERLRVPGEYVLPVPSLLPQDAQRLFTARARAAGAEITAADHGTVAEIAERLDGLPLAIELAAARLHTHELTEVAAGLDERFALLSLGYRGSARHGSLRAAVSWSYDLLDEPRRRLFAGLSVFAGTFTATDADAVLGAGPDDLTHLVERSLVVRPAVGRYALLETLRAFGAEQLAATGSERQVRDRHAGHFVAWVEAADRRLHDGGPGVLVSIEAALPNLRAAHEHTLVAGRADLGARLVVALRDYGLFRSRPDVLAWAEHLAGAPVGHPLASLVEVVRAYGGWLAGDMAGCARSTAAAWELAQAAGTGPAAEVLTASGSLALFEGRLAEAADLYRRGALTAAGAGDEAQRVAAAASELLALAYAGDPAAVARADELLSEIGGIVSPHAAYGWYCAGEAMLGVDDERARQRFTRAIELSEQTGAGFVTGVAGASRASIDARVGDPAAAAEAYRWLIPHWQRAGVWSTQWTMLRSVALLLARLGRFREAAVLEAAIRSTEEGHRIFGADEEALTRLAQACRQALGEPGYAAAQAEGSRLGGGAATATALAALR